MTPLFAWLQLAAPEPLPPPPGRDEPLPSAVEPDSAPVEPLDREAVQVDIPPPPEGETQTATAGGYAPGGYGKELRRKTPSSAALARQSTGLPTGKIKRGRYRPPGSPQRFGIEIKFGPYLPTVDQYYDGTGLGPYAQVFGRTGDRDIATGQPKPGLMSAIAFEYQFFYAFGPLLAGIQVGFFRDSAQALLADEPATGSVRSEADKTSFTVMPVVLQVGYRFEYLADRYRWVPLVPYAKAGLGSGFWWSKDGSKHITTDGEGNRGAGGSWGYQFNLGGMIRLDFIDPSTAKNADVQLGLNHTYVFGEYQFSQFNGFGRLVSVGDGTYMIGFAMEF